MKRLAVFVLLFAAPVWADPPRQSAEPPAARKDPAPEPCDKPGCAVAAPAPVLTLPKEKSAPVNFPAIIAPTQNTGGTVAWLLPDPGVEEVALADLFGPDLANQAKGRIFYARTPGRYRIWAVCASGSVVSPKAECVFIVGDAPPVPPVPPGPNPPTPPGPTPPTPGPAPIPGDGLRVLIVYESADLNKLPKDQLNVLYSPSVLGYLNTHCAKGPDGKTPEWRIWDQNVPTGAEAKTWQDAMARKRDKLPWLIVSNGKAGFEGPLPPNTDAMLRTLQTYGGQ